MIKVNLSTKKATREQLPDFLYGLNQKSLYDLSWSDPALGVYGFGWWPEDVQMPVIDDTTQKYGDEELSADLVNKKVIVSRAVIQLSTAEIAEIKQKILSAKLAEIDRMAKDKRDFFIKDYSPGEMASWPIKRSEALSYQSATTPSDANAPALSAEAAVRGISTQNLVAKVIENSGLLINIESMIAGTSGKHRDALSSMSTAQAIRDYDISVGWPVF